MLITDPKKILQEIQNFYCNLCKRDPLRPSEYMLNSFLNNSEIPKLTNNEARICEGKLTVDAEGYKSLQLFENNKSPGNRDLKHRQRNARRRRLQPKEDWVEGFVLRLVALAAAFKNVRNLLLINHNDGFIDDDEFVLLYNLFASKNLDFPYDSYAIDLEELDESESFAEFRFRKRDIRTLKEVLQIPDMITCNQRSVCDGLEGLCMLLKRLSFPYRYGFELVLARQPWFRIPLKEKSF